MTGRSPSVYDTGAFSILFPQIPHMAVCGTQESQWEYIYIDPIPVSYTHLLDIALQTGFHSLSSFNRYFHKIVGRNPQARCV